MAEEDVDAVSGGHVSNNGKSYWLSWLSDEQKLRNARWNWFTGRNYCRTMCMDMVSFETSAEQQFVEGWMDKSGLDNVHTAGRLCDAEVEGCNQTRFQPLKINGWFWASTLKMMPPTNAVSPNRFVSLCQAARALLVTNTQCFRNQIYFVDGLFTTTEKFLNS